MPMYRTKPIEARCLDFDYPDQIADIENWCGGKRYGAKLMVSDSLAYEGWYVVKTATEKFIAVEPGLWTALFGQMSPRA